MSEQKKIDDDKSRKVAISVLEDYDRHLSAAANFRDLYQDTADLIHPRMNQIMQRTTSGEDKYINLIDTTGVQAAQEMSSGLSNNLIPIGAPFFSIQAADRRLNQDEFLGRAFGVLTNVLHEHLFNSNFITQINETLHSLCVFGTGCIFSEWYKGGLNFRDYDVGSFLISEDARRNVDIVWTKSVLTAKQAHDMWGERAGTTVIESMNEGGNKNREFDFITVVRPRKKRNSRFRDASNMPYERLIVSRADKVVVDEGGFEEFPYHVARWTRSALEVYGRGQGTMALPDVRQLQWIRQDLSECSNRWNRPPLEVLEAFEGEVDMSPGAINTVNEINTINPIRQGANGNFPITKDIYQMLQDDIKRKFFNDVFVQLGNLTGDRRNELEIRERIGEGLRRLGPHILRLEELLSPLIVRSAKMLLRHGKVLDEMGEVIRLPREITSNLKVEYVSRLSLELKSYQARGAQSYAFMLAELEQAVPPNVVERPMDNIDLDAATRRIGEAMGVNVNEDMPSQDIVAQKRQQRAEMIATQRAQEMAMAAAEGYGKTHKAAEDGSAAKEVINAISE